MANFYDRKKRHYHFPPPVKTRSLNFSYSYNSYLLHFGIKTKKKRDLLKKLISPHHFITTTSNYTLHIHNKCHGLCLVGRGLAAQCSPPHKVYTNVIPLPSNQQPASVSVWTYTINQLDTISEFVPISLQLELTWSIPQQRKHINMSIILDKMIYSTLQPGTYSHHFSADETCNPVTWVTQPPRQKVRSKVLLLVTGVLLQPNVGHPKKISKESCWRQWKYQTLRGSHHCWPCTQLALPHHLPIKSLESLAKNAWFSVRGLRGLLYLG